MDGTCAVPGPIDGADVEETRVAEQPLTGEPVVEAQPAIVAQPAAVPVEYIQPLPAATYQPSLAHAGQIRLKLGFLLGFGGRQSVTVDIGGSDTVLSEGLAPSYGVELDFQKNFGRVFFTSGTLRYTSLELGGDSRFGVFGFDLGVGVHYAFDVGPIAIDPFFSAHAGLGFGSDGENGAFGVAVALKLGASLWFHRVIGAYVAGGYRGSAFLSGARAGASGSNLRQGTMDVGVVFRFGE